MVFVKLTADNLVKKRGEKAQDLFHSSFCFLRRMKSERISWVSVHLVIHHISLFFFVGFLASRVGQLGIDAALRFSENARRKEEKEVLLLLQVARLPFCSYVLRHST